MKKDLQTTEARHFIENGSFVFKDGREFLVGLDWKKRKVDLWIRCHERCEMSTILHKPHAPGCSGEAEEPHHITPRSKGRDDRMLNLVGLSHACHASLDPRKP